MKFTVKSLYATILVLPLIIFSCQEDELIDSTDQLDQDMAAASDMAANYLGSKGGRAEDAERSITVLRFVKGKLFFDTNTDDYEGYQEIEETSVTAYAEPGEYVFWYSGDGVTDLEEIDFDETAEDFLESLPDEIDPDRMWVMQVPLNSQKSVEFLKYDIVYETENSQFPIRLDPKIQIEN